MQRGFEVVVGVLSIDDNGVALVLPDDRRFSDSVFVAPGDLNGAKTNTKVVLDILDYPSRLKMARGRVREVLGDPNDVKVTTLSIIRSFNLFEEFPEDVESEAKTVSKPVKFEKLDDRKDYRTFGQPRELLAGRADCLWLMCCSTVAFLLVGCRG